METATRPPALSGALSGAESGDATGPAQAIAAAVEAARGWLRLLATRQLPSTLRSKVAPSDLVQKTLLEAFVHSSRFEGTTREEVYRWLRRILRNNVHDCIRQFRHCRGRDVRIERRLDELDSHERDDPALHGEPPAEIPAMIAEEDSMLAAALAGLPPLHRTVVRLRCWERLDWNDIGARVGRSGDAARKIWGRSIVRLRADLHTRRGDGGK